MTKLRKLDLAGLPRVQQAQQETRCLYVIQEAEDHYFKIGIAGHPARRLSALQSGNRRKLNLVAAYAGTDAECAFFEKATLKYFKARPGSEWVCVERLDEIIGFLEAFCEG